MTRTSAGLAATRPLAGLRVLVTRPAGQARGLCDALTHLGATAVPLALLAVEPVPVARGAWTAVERAEWAVFTSANGVTHAWSAAPPAARDALRSRARLAAVGPGTAGALAALALPVERVAEPHVAEALADLLVRADARSVAWLRGAEARDVLAPRLRAAGALVTEVVVYRTTTTELDDASRALIAEVDVITLASPSAARRLASAVHPELCPPVVCLGPITGDAAYAAGLDILDVATPHTVDGLIAALVTARGRLAPRTTRPIA